MAERTTTSAFPDVGTTASSIAPRRRLEYHQQQIRNLQHLILEHEADIRSLYNQLHNHLSRIQVLLGSTVCLTAYEHERLIDRLGGGGTAGSTAGASGRSARSLSDGESSE